MNISREVNSSSRSKKRDEIIKPLFDIKTLDYYCRYIVSRNQNIRTSGLNLVKELFNRVDISLYGNDIERINRIKFIQRGLEARLKKKLIDRDLIIQYINGGLLTDQIIDISQLEELSDETIAYLNEQAAELTKSYFVDDKYEEMLRLAGNLKNTSNNQRAIAVRQIQELTSNLNLQFNKMDDAVRSAPMFTLVPGDFEASMTDIYARETSPSRILKTGMSGLNMMLGGGFYASRVYILFAQAAGGKSFTMIDLAMQIKKYNKDYIPHDPTKIPTIVFLTMENSQDENISRMLNMSSGKTFNDYTLEESCEAFRMNGLSYSRETDPIDIVMIYKSNLSVNTDYLYTIVDKLRESGREPICIFQDHIKRIRPVNRHNDMRLDLGEIVNEFKAFANEMRIPVITDSHLNRDAAKSIDESSENSKKDLIKTLGSFNVSESYLMIDNCDVGIIINKEKDSEQNVYMGFKQIKTRTKCWLELFYQPYTMNIDVKLIEDIDSPTPAFKRTLKPDPMQNSNRMMRKSDYLGGYAVNRAEYDDLSMGDAISEEPTDDILLPDNKNQNKFIVVGAPSKPIFPIEKNVPKENSISTKGERYIMSNDGSEWAQQLCEMKLRMPGAKCAIAIFDDNDNVITDGVDDFM